MLQEDPGLAAIGAIYCAGTYLCVGINSTVARIRNYYCRTKGTRASQTLVRFFSAYSTASIASGPARELEAVWWKTDCRV